MANNIDLIKVHVTPTQREYLEFLVNRRINDLGRHKASPDTEEYRQLLALKEELRHAGT